MKIKQGSLKKIKENVPVYCMEVEGNHNFFIRQNGKDVAVKNCAGWSIKTLLEEGFGGVKGKIQSGPAKHMNSAMQQIVNFLGCQAIEWNGAQAFSSFDTYLAPFIRVDNMKYEEVKQCIESCLFGLNIPSRWGSQPPFSNVTLDILVPSDLKDQYPVIGGKKQSFTYGEIQEEMNMFNKAFFDVFEKGDYNGNIFQYPIITHNCTKEFFEDIDPTVEEALYRITAKYGIQYFSNYVSTGLDASDIRSMCSIHPESLIDVELEEDIVEYDGKFYTMEQATRKNLI